MRPERSELLMPAGSLHNMRTAVLYGADAIYVGTPDMSLRTKANFSVEDVIEGVKFAHAHGKRVYLTLNLYAHNKDIEKLPQFIETIRQVRPDGVIIADPGVFQYVKENAPELELHISTQANICSWLTVDYWHKQGASLCVLAREVSYNELKEIREKCPEIKLEAFVHGAMCMTYSGRCLLSNFMAERGSNQGNCAHSCRWKYTLKVRLRDGSIQELEVNEDNKDMFEFLLEEECRPGELMPIEEDAHGSYILNSKDLCLLPKLDEYLSLGVDSLKVEGRHKTAYYVAVVARTYRKAIDDWYADPTNWSPEPYMKELQTIQNRGYTLAFHEGRLTNHSHDYDTTASLADWRFGGFIREWQGNDMIFEVRNTLNTGDVLEFLAPNEIEPIRLRLYDFTCAKTGDKVERASGGQGFALRIPTSAFDKEDPETIKSRLPELTVARGETPYTQDVQELKTKVRIRSHQAEYGKITPELYDTIKADSQEKLQNAAYKPSSKPAKENKQSQCCGRGCNGCLTFWHDEKYAKAREALAAKKMGHRLSPAEKNASQTA